MRTAASDDLARRRGKPFEAVQLGDIKADSPFYEAAFKCAFG